MNWLILVFLFFAVFVLLYAGTKNKALGLSGGFFLGASIILILCGSLMWVNGLVSPIPYTETIVHSADTNGTFTDYTTTYNYISYTTTSDDGFNIFVQTIFWGGWVVLLMSLRKLYDNFITLK